MATERLDDEMIASYAVAIVGVKRAKAEMALVDAAITSLRAARYMPSAPSVTVTEARFGTSTPGLPGRNKPVGLLQGQKNVFAAQVDLLEGRVLGATRDAMAAGMAEGRRVQTAALKAAETKTGLSGKPKKRRGPGRDVTGKLIGAIGTNVETERLSTMTNIIGWHGWGREIPVYFKAQELGSKGRKSGQQKGSVNRKVKTRKKGAAAGAGVPAANSLGAAIVIVREELKRTLGKLR